MNLYFDTSAFVKLVVTEPESDLAVEFWRSTAATISTSILSIAEGQAAVAGARRSGRLNDQGMKLALEDLAMLQGNVALVGADRSLVETAGLLAVKFGLRGYDALHLASALSLKGERTIMVSWDRDLSAAARSVGLGALPD